VGKYINRLAKGGYIEYQPGQYISHKSRFRINEPILVHKSIEEISYKQGGNKRKRGRPGKARYTHKSAGDSGALSGVEPQLEKTESVGDSGKSVGDSGESPANSDNKEIRKRLEREVKDEKSTADRNTAISVLKDWDAVIDSKRVAGGKGEALCPTK
jgi:hypothetical protein